MNEIRFNNFKKSIAPKKYGKFWSEAKNTFNIDFKDGNFISKGARNYLPTIYNPKLNRDDLLDFNFESKEDKKILKLGRQRFCIPKENKNKTLISAQNYLNSINSYINEKDIVCEVGSGNGLFSALINERKKTTNILIDIPEVLLNAISLILTVFPNKKILLPNEIEELSSPIIFNQYDFVFLTPDLIYHIKDESVNLGINTQSFMEMDMIEVDEYLNFFNRIISNEGYFFCSNRIRKRHYFFEYKFYLLKNFQRVFFKKNSFFYSLKGGSSMLDLFLKKDKQIKQKSIRFNLYEKFIILTKFKRSEFFRWLTWDFHRVLKKVYSVKNLFS